MAHAPLLSSPLKRLLLTSLCRLADSLWIFFLSLGLQMLINGYFIHEYYAHLPTGEVTVNGASIWTSLFISLLRSSFWSTQLWWGLALLKNPSRTRNIYTTLTIALSIAICFLEGYLLSRYQTVYTLSIAQIIAGTNPKEIQEYFEMVMTLPTILSTVVCLALIVAIYRYLSKVKISPNRPVCVCV